VLERLIETLLWEGYALYPYTPGATKNATPTPFGIVYPPAYAAGLPSAFDYLELRGELEEPAEISGEVHFLATTGNRHEGEAHRVTVGPGTGSREYYAGHVRVRVTLSLAGRTVALRVENLTRVAPGLDRAAALHSSLISTHPVLLGGRFRSPLDVEHGSVNTWPVLAEGALLGAAIILPDNPQIAPESRGSLFDGTEIEEALLLHVHALSDAERAEIAAADPAVAEMVARAATTTPADITALHGRVTMRDPQLGEDSSVVDGVTFRRGGRVRLRPGPDSDLEARLVAGRTATIEKIFVDFEGKTYLAVTVEGLPGQELLRESGRFMFFFAPEVEVLS
jgi:hypothetical protein